MGTLKENLGAKRAGNDPVDAALLDKPAQEAGIHEHTLSILVEQSAEGMAILSAEGKLLYISPSVKNVLGYTCEEVMELGFLSIAHPDDFAPLADTMQQVLANPGLPVKGHTGRMLHKDGSWRWIEATVRNMLHDAAINGIIDIFRDITERKEAEDLILKNERKFRSLIENSADAMAILSADGQPMYISPSFVNVLGYTEKEAMQLDLFSLAHPDDAPSLISLMIRTMSEPGVAIKGEVTRMLHKDGNWRWIEGSITNMLHDPAVNGIVDNFRDVTEKKIAEEKIIHANRLYAFISKINQAIVHVKDEQTLFNDACRIAVEEGGFNMAWIGMTDSATRKTALHASFGVSPDDVGVLGELIQSFDGPIDIVMRGSPYYVVTDTRKERASGWYRFMYQLGLRSLIVLPIKKSGKVIGTFNIYSRDEKRFNAGQIELLEKMAEDISFALDVFEKARLKLLADEKLRYSELRLKQSQSIAHLGSWEADLATGTLLWSEEALRIHGLPIHDTLQTYESWLSFIHPDDLEYVVTVNDEARAQMRNSSFFHRIIRRDGTIRHLLSQALFEFNNEGIPTCLYGVSHDITEIKEAEAALKESESNLQAIFENTSDAFILADTNGIIKAFNSKARDIIFLNVEETIGVNKSIFDFIAESRREMYKELIAKVLSGETIRYDNSFERINGVIKWFNFTINPVYIADAITGFSISSADITERKETEELLRISQSNLAAIIEHADAVIFSLDKELKFITFNQRLHDTLAKFYGVDMKPGDHFFVPSLKLSPEEKSQWQQIYKRGLNGETVKFEKEFLSDELISYISFSVYPILKDNTVIGLSCFGYDTTKEKSDAAEKKNLQELLDKANKLARIGNWEIDLVSNALYWSDITRQIHEVADDFVPGIDNAAAFFQGGTGFDAVVAAITDAMQKGIPFDLEAELLTAKGNNTWVRVVGEAEFKDKTCLRLYGSCQDIDARKKAELELLKIYNEKNTLLESIDDAFFAVDKNWTINYWNKKAHELCGLKETIVGSYLWDVFPASIDSMAYRQFHTAIETNQVVRFEEYLDRLGKWFEISAFPSPNGLSVYCKDVSSRKLSEIRFKELNLDLQKHAKELALSNKELEHFAYVASHDLQEPLRMITGFLTQIDKKYGDVVGVTGKQYINFAVDGAKRMKQIIMDLLEFSRVGKSQDNLEQVNLDELMKEIISLYKKQMEETNAVILFRDLPVIVNNRSIVQQVFQNLVSNALKYQSKGKAPVITISWEETTVHWKFSVADNGIGINPAHFEKVFVIFQRLHNKGEYSGTGIGLAVCKKIIERMGGNIWLESVEGSGSTFYFTIPKKL